MKIIGFVLLILSAIISTVLNLPPAILTVLATSITMFAFWHKLKRHFKIVILLLTFAGVAGLLNIYARPNLILSLVLAITPILIVKVAFPGQVKVNIPKI